MLPACATGRCRRTSAGGEQTSLLAFICVYFIVFGAGIYYILKLMSQPPHAGEAGPAEVPVRAAGLTAVVASHGEG